MNKIKPFSVLLLILLTPILAFAYSPIARFDVVPYQRIQNGSSLNVGVVAFSKPRIDNVVFTITGQGYASGTKTSSAMALNSTTGVWEYFVNIPASEFSSNGAITVTALVTDLASNTRELTLPLIVQGASAHTPTTCWADSVSGNNTTCTADDEGAPCQTIAGCISKLGASASGDIIYLEEGTYSANTTATTSTADWLTITKDDTAAVANVIINAGQLGTGYLKYDSVTLQSQGASQYVANNESTYLWTNNCRRIGSGRTTANTNPIHYPSNTNHFSTNDYTYNADYAYRQAAIVRSAEISTIANDAFANAALVINSTVDDLDPGSTYWHGDMYQAFTGASFPVAINNTILYGVKGTNLHYQGVFMRSENGTAFQDDAFVNVALEMTEPARLGNAGGLPAFTSLSLNDTWDHLLIWNCSFLFGHAVSNGTYTNSSFVGNVFYQFQDTRSSIGTPTLSWAANGNAGGNEVLYNHFEYVYGVTGSCTPNDRFEASSWPCPNWQTKNPDSGASPTFTTGGGVIDQNNASPSYLYPVDDATLIDRFTPRVPVDLFNVERGSLSDVGAVELYPESDYSVPVRSGGSPSGTLAYATTKTISMATAGNATCKYGAVADTAYASIANTFSTTGATTHSSNNVPVSVGTNNFYVRCTDGVNPNTTDYTISFVIEQQDLPVPTTPGAGVQVNIGAGVPANVR